MLIDRPLIHFPIIVVCAAIVFLQLTPASAKHPAQDLETDTALLKQAEAVVDSTPNSALDLVTPILTRDGLADTAVLAHAYWIKARAHAHKSEYAKSIESGKLGLAHIGDSDLFLRANILEVVSLAMTRSNDTRRAYDFQQAAFSIRKQQGDAKGQAASLAILAEIYFDIGQLEKSRDNYQTALAQARLSENNYTIILALNNYAFSLMMGQEADQALHLLQEAELLIDQLDNTRVAAFVKQNIGHALVRLERPDDAEPYVRAALNYAQDNGPKELLTGIYLTLSRIEKTRGELGAAREYAQRALSYAKDVGYVERISDLHLLLSEIDFADGRIDRAYTNLQAHVDHLNDVSASSMNRSASLFAAHEELLKKKSELALSKKEAEIAQLEVARARSIRNAAILATGSLLFLLLGAIWSLREKIRASRILEKANAKLKSAYDEIELANSAKSNFISVMSHELRTPLNSVIGFSDIIEKEKLGPVGRQDYVSFARQINEQGAKLLRMVEDILLLTDAESGKLKLQCDGYHISEIFEAAQQQMIEQYDDAMERIVYLDDTDDHIIQCNDALLCRAFAKIVDNALKFTVGEVVVFSSNTNHEEVTLTISDAGPGFEEHEIECLLDPFRQADESRIRAHEGAGLGLSVANLIVKMHGGTLNIDTGKSGGTTVAITLSSAEMNSNVEWNDKLDGALRIA